MHLSRRTARRNLWLLIALLVFAAVWCGWAPADARADSAPVGQFAQLSDDGVYGPNQFITIEFGHAGFFPFCTEPNGTFDFVFPFTDVYLTPHLSRADGDELVDIRGTPRTLGPLPGGTILELTAGITQPSGSVPAGRYSLVFDECQDGKFNADEDFWLDNAASVYIDPHNVPPVLPAIRQFKAQALFLAVAWKSTALVLDALDMAEKVTEAAKCLLSGPPLIMLVPCGVKSVLELMEEKKEEDEAHAQGWPKDPKDLLKLIAENSAKSYLSLGNDPPDPEFQQLNPLAPGAPLDPASDDVLDRAMVDLGTSAANEHAIGEALLHAMERYQGAGEFGHAGWALRHARSIRQNAELLSAQLTASDTALDQLAAAAHASPLDLDTTAPALETLRSHLEAHGVSSEATRAAKNLGATDTEIAEGVTGFTGLDFTAVTPAGIDTHVSDMKASNADMRAALVETQTLIGDVISTLSALESVTDDAPEADAGGPYSGTEAGLITLSAAGSTAHGSGLATYEWDLDRDGEFELVSQTADASFMPPREGQFLIGLKVTNADGIKDLDYALVTVGDVNHRPTISSATPDSEIDLDVGATQLFSISASDPEGGALEYQWTVDFVNVPGATASSFSHTTTEAGPHFIRVTVSDGTFDGGTSVHSWHLVAHAPDADGDEWEANVDCNDGNADVHPDRSELVGNGVDDDCDAATPDEGSAPTAGWDAGPAIAGQPTPFSDASTDPNDDIVSWSWDFGDGTPAAGDRNPIHVFAAGGTYDVSLTVTDATGLTDSSSVAIDVAEGNGTPTAAADSVTVGKNTPGSVNVLFNDSDPDGDPLSVTAWTNGAHGFVSCTFAGLCTYTPGLDYVGADSFTYTVSDGNGGTGTGSVDVTVTEEPPANQDPTPADDVLVTDQDTASTVDVLANDVDPDGDPLSVEDWTHGTNGGVDCTAAGSCTYTPGAGFSGIDSFTYTVSDGRGGTAIASVAVTVGAVSVNADPIAQPDVLTSNRNDHGTANVLANDSDPDGDSIQIVGTTNGEHGFVTCAEDVCRYDPVFDYVGVDSFTYTISDGRGGTATGTVSVTVLDANRPPVAVDDTLLTPRDTPALVFLLGNDSDPDNDSLTVTATTTPAHGTVADCIGVGVCLYSPDADFFGTDSFDYTVSDGHGGTDIATVSITVDPNRPPVALADELVVALNTPGSVDVLGNDTDADGDTLDVTESTDGAHGAVSCERAGLCTYTPEADYLGPDSFTYTIDDGSGETATASVTVLVQRLLAAGPDWFWRPDKLLTFPITINDLPEVTHTCSWTFGDGGTSTDCTFAHTYDEVGTYDATVTVDFSNGTTLSETVEIRVVAEPPASETGGFLGRGEVVPSVDRTYTLDDDFDDGTLLNVNHNAPSSDQLQLNPKATPFPFLYVANSARGTAVRIDIETGEILGEFLTAPDGRFRNPSRTTVDKLGNVYVTNRDEAGELDVDGVPTPMGSFARYGLMIGGTRSDENGDPDPNGGYVAPPFQYSTCVDRDGDGLIRTSSGLGDILGWDNAGDVDHDGGVETAEDECLINYTRVLGINTRTVAIDSNNDAWIGGANNWHEKVNGDTGQRVPGTAFNLGCGGYGGLIDGNDVLWSARFGNGLLRYDTRTGTGDCFGSTIGDYGLGVDPTTGHIWHTYLFGNTVARINPDGTSAGYFSHGSDAAQGVAVDSSGNVWVAHSLFGATTVGHIRTDGTPVGNVDLPGLSNGPTGVAVDSRGRVWSANLNSDNATRIDPLIGPVGGGGFAIGYADLTVDLGPGAGPYNYSDMTGAVSVGAASRSGFWSIVQDGGTLGREWSEISWNGTTPGGTEITVEARSADTQTRLADEPFAAVGNGSELDLSGRFIEVRANLKTTQQGATPVLSDVRIRSAGVANNPPVASDGTLTLDEDASAPLPLSATDPDGDGLTFTIVTPPAHGTLTGTAPNFTYTPHANYHGPDAVTFRASDGALFDDGVVSITVTPVNDAPVAGDDALTLEEDTPVSIPGANLRANDTDVDGDFLTIAAVSDPQHGTVELVAGVVTFTPLPGYSGPAGFDYMISDGNGGTDTAHVAVTVEPVDDAPTAANLVVKTDEDVPVETTLLGNDPDGGDPLTFAVASAPTHGTLTGEGAALTYTPDPNYNGPDSFTYTVSSGSLTSASATVSITVTPVNDAPVAGDDEVETDEDTPVAIPAATLLANDTDPDGAAYLVPYGAAGYRYTQIDHLAPFAGFETEGFDDSAWAVGPAPFGSAVSGCGLTSATRWDGGTDLLVRHRFTVPAGTDNVLVHVAIDNDVTVYLNGHDLSGHTTSGGCARADNVGPFGVDAALLHQGAENVLAVRAEDYGGESYLDLAVTAGTLFIAAVSDPQQGTVELVDGVVTFTPAPGFTGDASFVYTLSDGEGGTDTATVTVHVAAASDAPSANDLTVETEEDTPVDITLTGSDPDGDTLDFAVAAGPAHGTLSGSGATLTYTPDENYHGPDSFTYTATDGTLTSEPATVSITVVSINDAPVAGDDALTIEEDTPVSIPGANLRANDTDVDGDFLTISAVSDAQHGTVELLAGIVTFTPAPDYHGPAGFDYTISDGNGGTDTAHVAVTVEPVDDAPTAANLAAQTDEDTPVEITLLGEDADGGDPLTFAVTTSPAHGTLTGDGAALTYTPDPNYHGPDAFTYTVSSGSLTSAPAAVSITVRPVNDAPSASDVAIETDEETPVGITLAGSDPDGDALDFEVVIDPAHGTLTGSGASRTYTPDPDFSGPDSFTYEATDGTLNSATATVSITVYPVNDPPSAQSSEVTTPEDTPVELTFVGSDVDGDTLALEILEGPAHGTLEGSTYTPHANYHGPDSVRFRVSDGLETAEAVVSITVTPVNDSPVAGDDEVETDEDTALTIPGETLRGNDTDVDGDFLTISAVGDAQNGTVELVAGVVTFTPAPGFSGVASFTYTISDGNGGSDTATVTATVAAVNDRPSANDLSGETNEDAPVDITLTGSDPDGDALDFEVVDGPAHGTLGGNGVTRTYTPDPNYHGPDSFTYEASDGALTSAPASVSITVLPVNDAPVANDDAFSTDEDTPLAIPGAALSANDTDVDGDPLTVSAVADAQNGTVELAGGIVTFTPAAGFNGLASFTYTVSDGNGGTDTATVTIDVGGTDDAPSANDLTVETDEDTPVEITLTGSDADGDAITFAVATGPAHGTLSGSGAMLTYTPDENYHGPDSFTYTATAGPLTSAPATVSITVRPVNDRPFPSDVEAETDEDTPVDITLLGTDPDGDALTFIVVDAPEHGTLSGEGATLTYTPDADHNGTDFFTYAVSDGSLTSDAVVVPITIQPVNDAPVASDDAFSTGEDTALLIEGADLRANDTDVDGDFLTVSAVSDAVNGTVDLAGGIVTFTPARGFSGLASFTYTVSDGKGSSDTATVTVTVGAVNDAPRATDAAVTTAEDTPVELTFAGIDADGDTLTFEVVTGPQRGTLVGNTYTPAANYHGPDSVTFRASDGTLSDEGLISITVTPVADAPVATDASATSAEDTPVELAFAGTDPDGDTLTFDVVTGPQHGTLVGTTYTPNPNYHGPDSVTFRASDGSLSDEGLLSITVTPVNDAPVCAAQSAETRQETPVDVTPSCTDIEGDALTYQIAGQGLRGVASIVGSLLHYAPNAGQTGEDTFRYRALDGLAGSNEAPVTITITPIQQPNDPPLCANQSFATTAGAALSNRVTCTDADGDSLAYSLVGGTAGGALTLAGDGTFTYTPASGFTGTDSFRFKADDGKGGSSEAVASIAVTPVGDVTPPSCGFSTQGTNALGQKLIRASVRDTGSGLGGITVLRSTNATVQMPDFVVGRRSSLYIWATQIDKDKPTIVEFAIADVAGNVTVCDPVFTTVRIKASVRGRATPQAQTFLGLPQAESKLVVRNKRPGLQRLDVIVNGKRFRLALRPGQMRRLDFARAMKPGRANTVTIRGYGKPGARADIVIADVWA